MPNYPPAPTRIYRSPSPVGLHRSYSASQLQPPEGPPLLSGSGQPVTPGMFPPPTPLTGRSLHHVASAEVLPCPPSAAYAQQTFPGAGSTAPVFARLDYGIVGTDAPDSTPFWGWVLLGWTVGLWGLGMYWIFLSEWVPDTGSAVLDWIKYDRHYGLMIPLLLPVTLYAVIWNWVGLKFFRHN